MAASRFNTSSVICGSTFPPSPAAITQAFNRSLHQIHRPLSRFPYARVWKQKARLGKPGLRTPCDATPRAALQFPNAAPRLAAGNTRKAHPDILELVEIAVLDHEVAALARPALDLDPETQRSASSFSNAFVSGSFSRTLRMPYPPSLPDSAPLHHRLDLADVQAPWR